VVTQDRLNTQVQRHIKEIGVQQKRETAERKVCIRRTRATGKRSRAEERYPRRRMSGVEEKGRAGEGDAEREAR
jgi:hypothetical protein